MNIDKPSKGKLLNWKLVPGVTGAGELGMVIQGSCPEHPTLKGDWIQTSLVKRVFVETETSVYELDISF
jgi:hypothetical protein